VRTRAFTFADELVRAALGDRLGELVVPMRPQPVTQSFGLSGREWIWPPRGDVRSAHRDTWTIGCPLGAVGDRIWSRECWAACREAQQSPPEIVWFRSDMSRWAFWSPTGKRSLHSTPKAGGVLPPRAWRSALQMPRDLSRLTYEITALRCERVQHVTADSARLRGFASVAEFRAWWDRASSGSRPRAPRDGESWDENPWVFVASVRRVEMR
jgi:hypothetical protein